MPFGLKNSAFSFQRLMERVLNGILYKSCMVFIDDVLIIGKTWEEHLQNLRLVFERLASANLKLKLKKCDFGKSQVEYLGFVVTPEGVKVNSSKIDKIQNL